MNGNRGRQQRNDAPRVRTKEPGDLREVPLGVFGVDQRLQKEDDETRDERPERIARSQRDAENPRVESTGQCDEGAPDEQQARCDEE